MYCLLINYYYYLLLAYNDQSILNWIGWDTTTTVH